LETLEIFMSRGGNTSTPRVVPSKRWCFTWNNYSKSEVKDFKKILADLKCKYIIGKEVGESGTKHLQGYLECPKKIRPIETFRIKVIHWEKTKGDRDDNIKYCSKDGNFVTNFKIIIDPLAGKKLYKWQKKVIKIINGPVHDRKIYWFWEPDGCTGKTTLAKHICMNYSALYVNGAGKDIKYALSQVEEMPDIIIFGIPRSSEGYVSYGALEELKDGILFSPKYESTMMIFNPPHILVFANFEPDRDLISLDRWEIKRL